MHDGLGLGAGYRFADGCAVQPVQHERVGPGGPQASKLGRTARRRADLVPGG
jgi:hypothetical protein